MDDHSFFTTFRASANMKLLEFLQYCFVYSKTADKVIEGEQRIVDLKKRCVILDDPDDAAYKRKITRMQTDLFECIIAMMEQPGLNELIMDMFDGIMIAKDRANELLPVGNFLCTLPIKKPNKIKTSPPTVPSKGPRPRSRWK